MTRTDAVIIRRASTGEVVLARARWCQSFWCHLRGLMFRRTLAPDEGLLFVYSRPGISNTAIHMFFVFFPIAAVWLDDAGQVVGTALARPWRPYYAPRAPARYLIEAAPALLEHVSLGEQLVFERASER